MKLSVLPLILQIYVILVPSHFENYIFFSTWIFEEKVLSWLILIKFPCRWRMITLKYIPIRKLSWTSKLEDFVYFPRRTTYSNKPRSWRRWSPRWIGTSKLWRLGWRSQLGRTKTPWRFRNTLDKMKAKSRWGLHNISWSHEHLNVLQKSS